MGVSSTPPTPPSSWSSSSSMTSPSSPFASWSAPFSIKVSSVCLALKHYEEIGHEKKQWWLHQWQMTCMSILIIYSNHILSVINSNFFWKFLEMGILNVHTNQLKCCLCYRILWCFHCFSSEHRVLCWRPSLLRIFLSLVLYQLGIRNDDPGPKVCLLPAVQYSHGNGIQHHWDPRRNWLVIS